MDRNNHQYWYPDVGSFTSMAMMNKFEKNELNNGMDNLWVYSPEKNTISL